MKTLVLLLFLALCAHAQTTTTPPPTPEAKAAADSARHAKMHADSVRMAKLFSIAQYPYIKGSKWSGIIPVDQPTEVPDPNKEYKLLFEVIYRNKDSISQEINQSLDEVARILNLHVASGIPAKNLLPVILVHGPGLEAVATNEVYRRKHKIDNPNLQIYHDLLGAHAKFIACGQDMAFFDYKKEDLLPEVKISLTAQTVLSNYQEQGYVLYSIDPNR